LNRKNTPQDVVDSKLIKGETVARYSQGVMIGKWKDKRDVGYISTEFKNNLILTKNRNGKEQFKPEPISNYNRFMSGIDRQDQMHSYYPFTRKTIRWYKKIGIHIIQMLLMNSFYLYNQYHAGPKISLYDFRLSILSELCPNIQNLDLFQYHILIISQKLTMLENLEDLTEKDVICVILKGSEKIQHTSVQAVRKSPVFVINHVSKIFINSLK